MGTSTFPNSTHASRHAAGGPDAVSPAAIGAVPSAGTVKAVTGAYTVLVADADKILNSTSATAITATVPSGLSLTGKAITFVQSGAGQVTVAAGSGVTINSPNGLKLRGQYSLATLICLAADTYVLVGDTTT